MASTGTSLYKGEVCQTFTDFGLARETLEGLKRSKYFIPTAIQKGVIPVALEGKDVLAAAKTGSGKTLAFIVPLLEKLYEKYWQFENGLGALVLSPTRELAHQTYKVLTMVGQLHQFSGGLVVGGHKVEEEKKRMWRMNIIIATPGRILQHMDETENFETSTLQILVLDEADRILDMGFKKTLEAIINNLPKNRQTLLFSATQTKDIKVLERLSLKNPEYVSVHAESETATPKRLSQNYLVCPLEDKLNILYSFIRTHMYSKTIVFFSTCNQARFYYELFSKLFMKSTLACALLNSKMKQMRRNEVFHAFCAKSSQTVLFCTDIAARGLDFPAVDWVLQVDAPGNEDEYIHRVGRTARIGSKGKALTFFLPSEEMMIPILQRKKLPLREVEVNPDKWSTCNSMMVAFLVQYVELKVLAQKAFNSYFRSLHFQPNTLVFDVSKIDAEAYARSLGLENIPKLSILASNRAKNVSWDFYNAMNEEDKKKEKPATKMERKQQANAMWTQMQKRESLLGDDKDLFGEDDDDDEPFLKPSKTQRDIEPMTEEEKAANMSKKQLTKLREKKAKWAGTIEKFSSDESEVEEEGKILQKYKEGMITKEDEEAYVKELEARLAKADKKDKKQHIKRVKAKRLRIKHSIADEANALYEMDSGNEKSDGDEEEDEGEEAENSDASSAESEEAMRTDRRNNWKNRTARRKEELKKKGIVDSDDSDAEDQPSKKRKIETNEDDDEIEEASEASEEEDDMAAMLRDQEAMALQFLNNPGMME